MPIPTRRLPISGGYNYRDLGGYPTLDGHTIKWRRLLRSGSLHRLTSQDLQYFSDMKLAKDIDLRSPRETKKSLTKSQVPLNTSPIQSFQPTKPEPRSQSHLLAMN